VRYPPNGRLCFSITKSLADYRVMLKHNLRLRLPLSIGVLLLTALVAPWCAAQYPADNGFGNSPMPPASPSNLYRPSVGGPPTQLPTTSRPSAWPGAAPAALPQTAPVNLPPANQLTLCEGTRILAHVGSEVILEGDVAGPVNDFLAANKDRIPPEQLEPTREFLIKKQLKNLIQGKLIYLDAKHTIPSEGWPQIEKQLEKAFDEDELDKMMKRVGASSRHELDEKLRILGTSVEREKRSFSERELARQWLHQQIKPDEQIASDQMVAAYYRQHLDEFTTPARVKWEELKVRSVKYPSDDAACAALARMGNQVLAGAKFADVAKAASDGATAPSGGAWDWTNKGALVCKEIDDALFDPRLPVGQLSPIIKGPDGFHIVRVITRQDTTVKPFIDAQVQIREKIVKERSDKQVREYLAKLEAKTPVSTIFDGQNESAQQLSNPPEIRR
jgi:parvulin-like peptidyl-prolyl isomerase